MIDVEQVVRFVIEVAKIYGENICSFYDQKEFELIERLYGKMTHFQTSGKSSVSLVKTGHSFNDWNTTADGSGDSYTPGATFPMGKAKLTLYAQWTANPTHTVSYDGNGNTGGIVPVSSSYEEGEPVTAAGNTGSLVKAGHSFNGWNTTADGTGTPYSAGATFLMGKANLTLYAKWSAVSITPPIDPGPGPGSDPVDPPTSPGSDPLDPPASPGSDPLDPPASPGPVDPIIPLPSSKFKDVSSNRSQEMIEYIASRGIITGYPYGTFRPNEPITRQHIALMLTRALKLESNKDVTGFMDVSTNHPYYEAIKQVQQAGIFEGNNGKFNPNANMTRAQIAKVIVLAFGLTSTDTQTFKDVPSTHWAHNYIAILAANGIALGDNGDFKPEEPVTRAQFAAFLYRVLNK